MLLPEGPMRELGGNRGRTDQPNVRRAIFRRSNSQFVHQDLGLAGGRSILFTLLQHVFQRPDAHRRACQPIGWKRRTSSWRKPFQPLSSNRSQHP